MELRDAQNHSVGGCLSAFGMDLDRAGTWAEPYYVLSLRGRVQTTAVCSNEPSI